MTVFELAFWVLLFVFGFCYSVYYALMYWASKKRSDQGKISEILPSISIVIASYNEENVISSKLENILKLNYPKEKMQLVLIDSGSKDKTQEKIQEFIRQQSVNADLNLMNKVIIFEKERKGKVRTVLLSNFNFTDCFDVTVLVTTFCSGCWNRTNGDTAYETAL